MDLTAYYLQVRALLGQNVYVESLAIFLSFIVATWVLIYIFEKVTLRIATKTRTELDDEIFRRINKYIPIVLILYGLKFGLQPFEIEPSIALLIEKGISTVIVLIIMRAAMVVSNIVIEGWGKRWAEKTESTVDDQLINILHKIISVVIFIGTIIFVLNTWKVNVTPLLASVGIAGVAIAFAMQNTLGNLFGGISMIIDKSVKVGDVVEIDKDTVGTILDVGLRSTKIRTFDNEVVILPNGKLADAKIKNYIKPDLSARLVIPFNVAYGSDVEKVKKVILKEVKNIEGVLKSPEPYVRFSEMSDYALRFKAYIWVKNVRKRFKIKDIANTKMYNALNKSKLVIPFPQMDVHLKKR